METSEIKQGTEAWRLARCGRITGSRLNDVLATVKSGEAAGRRNYRSELVVEIMTGCPTESFCNAAMQRGTELEPSARTCYEFANGVTVEQVGLVQHPSISFFAVSPDGYVGGDGLVEFKCPNTSNHIDWMLAGCVPSEHLNQIQGQMACTGRQWVDFVSYDPRMPIDLQLFTVRVLRDDARIAIIQNEVIRFWSDVQELVARLTELRR